MQNTALLSARPALGPARLAPAVADGVGTAWFLTGVGITTTFGALGLPFVGSGALDLLAWLALSVLGISGLSHLVFTLSRLVRRPLPPLARTFIGVAGMLTATLLTSLASWMKGFTDGAVPYVAVVLAVGGALGLSGLLGAGLVRRRGWPTDTLPRRRWTLAQLGLAVTGLAGVGAWLSTPPATPAALPRPAPTLTLPDPALLGPYAVTVLHYGSGVNRVRPEFSTGVDLRSSTVDARAYVQDWPALRTRYWGFSPAALPLNATVWLPRGTGPFPLVLIVHGAHRMTEASDPGYAYLGRWLATRGMIAASVDENFLNGGPLLYGAANGIGNDARARLLLEHLRQWGRWNDTPGTPFTGRVDLGRVALIGHSRGGEAAALAAAFADPKASRLDPGAALPATLRIRAVAALAPSEGQYRAAPAALRDVNYLVLQGSQDADARTFMGVRQYRQVTFTSTGTPPAFKAAVYIDRANHGQFNTVWGRTDYVPPLAWFLNLRAVLPGEQQRQITQVYLGAFLDAALFGRARYLPLFRDARVAGSWLPGTRYVTRYADGTARTLADFEPVTGGVPAQPAATGFQTVQVTEVPTAYPRDGSQANHALLLTWNRPGARYTLTFPQELDPRALDVLTLDVAVPAWISGVRAPDVTLVLRDAQGQAATAELRRFSPVWPPFTKRLSRWTLLEPVAAETAFQTFRIPLAAFQSVSGPFDSSRLTAVTLRVQQPAQGAVLVDDLALTAATGGEGISH